MEVTEQLSKALMDGGVQTLSEFAKAAETIATNTFSPASRSIFSPENLEAEVKLLVPMDTPMRNRLPRVQGLGEATAWKKLTSKLHHRSGGAAGIGTNTSIAFADAGAPNETTQTFVVTSEAYKLLGRKVELGGLAIAASRGESREDVYQQRQRHKLVELMIGEEELIIGGDKTANTLEFDGLSAQITTNSGLRSLLSVSGMNADIETIFREGSMPTMLLCNSRQSRALADELQGSGSIQRIMVDNQGNGIGGMRLAKFVNSIDGSLIDIVTSRYVADQAFLLSERSSSGEVWIDMSDLIPVSRVDVPSSNFSSISFVLEATTLRVIGEPFQYKYTGLAI